MIRYRFGARPLNRVNRAVTRQVSTTSSALCRCHTTFKAGNVAAEVVQLSAGLVSVAGLEGANGRS